MQAWHQYTLLEKEFPLNLFITDIIEFPPHWHEAVEVVYAMGGHLQIGINHNVYTLNESDIILINSGDVHHFLPQDEAVNRIILHFDMALFKPFSQFMDRRFTRFLFSKTDPVEPETGCHVHATLKKYTLEILDEYAKRKEGYQLVLKARLFDIFVTLLRYAPTHTCTSHEKTRKLNRLDKLQKVFQFVEQHYEQAISLEEIASVANYSVFHFSRFFKESTGMTFLQYMNNFRVTKAMDLLFETSDTITEVAFKSGFGSIKTFNRVFKEIKGCTPSQYRSARSG